VIFGGDKRQPEIRLRSQATTPTIARKVRNFSLSDSTLFIFKTKNKRYLDGFSTYLKKL